MHINTTLTLNDRSTRVTGNQHGNACGSDSDGDSVSDTDDYCPHNPAINRTSFWPYTYIELDPTVVTTNGVNFELKDGGREVIMTSSNEMPFILLGAIALYSIFL